MGFDPRALPLEAEAFLAERHLATLTTRRPDGSLHAVAVGFTWDPEAAVARVITSGTSRKVRHVEAGSRAVLAQVDGPRWLSLEGPARVRRDPGAVAYAEERYAARYRTPRPNPARVVLEVTVERVLGRVVRRVSSPQPPESARSQRR
jgi:PPOX class probable F420-dependent enzyme